MFDFRFRRMKFLKEGYEEWLIIVEERNKRFLALAAGRNEKMGGKKRE